METFVPEIWKKGHFLERKLNEETVYIWTYNVLVNIFDAMMSHSYFTYDILLQNRKVYKMYLVPK